MNILKQIFAVTAIVAVFSLIACGGDDGNGKDDPKDQSQIITLTFGETSPTATVKGHLTDTEWDGVADKIKDAINAFYMYYEDRGSDYTTRYENVFERDVIIIVEKTTEYANWKTTGDGKTMYLAFSAMNNIEDRQKIGGMILATETYTADNG